MIHPRNYTVIVLLVLACVLTGYGQGQPAAGMQAPNTLYGELGGKGLLYGFYYERLIVPQLGVSAGFSTWDISFFTSTSVTIVPLFLSWYSATQGSRLYIDGGVDIVSLTTSFDEFGTLSGNGVIPFIGTGYCYRNSNGGFYFRIGPLFLIAPGRVQPWANLSLGFTF